MLSAGHSESVSFGGQGIFMFPTQIAERITLLVAIQGRLLEVTEEMQKEWLLTKTQVRQSETNTRLFLDAMCSSSTSLPASLPFCLQRYSAFFG